MSPLVGCSPSSHSLVSRAPDSASADHSLCCLDSRWSSPTNWRRTHAGHRRICWRHSYAHSRMTRLQYLTVLLGHGVNDVYRAMQGIAAKHGARRTSPDLNCMGLLHVSSNRRSMLQSLEGEEECRFPAAQPPHAPDPVYTADRIAVRCS